MRMHFVQQSTAEIAHFAVWGQIPLKYSPFFSADTISPKRHFPFIEEESFSF